MRQKLKMLGLLFPLLIISWNSSIAQESINATGEDIQGSGGSMSYSIGQVEYRTNSGSNASIAEGVQQPYEISVITGINKARGIKLSVKAYPNPTIDNIVLEINNIDFASLDVQLYDMNGKLLQSQTVKSKRTQIPMENLVSGIYFLKVRQKHGEIKTFKIVKTH